MRADGLTYYFFKVYCPTVPNNTCEVPKLVLSGLGIITLIILAGSAAGMLLMDMAFYIYFLATVGYIDPSAALAISLVTALILAALASAAWAANCLADFKDSSIASSKMFRAIKDKVCIQIEWE